MARHPAFQPPTYSFNQPQDCDLFIGQMGREFAENIDIAVLIKVKPSVLAGALHRKHRGVRLIDLDVLVPNCVVPGLHESFPRQRFERNGVFDREVFV
jgi:hypothetical protein